MRTPHRKGQEGPRMPPDAESYRQEALGGLYRYRYLHRDSLGREVFLQYLEGREGFGIHRALLSYRDYRRKVRHLGGDWGGRFVAPRYEQKGPTLPTLDALLGMGALLGALRPTT